MCQNKITITYKILIILSLIFQKTFSITYPDDFGPTLFAGGHGIEFDFIVVGAGSAGSVVATRLSEVLEWNVLLLEDGGDPPDVTEVPLKWSLALKTEYDWQFITEPEENMFKGLHDGKCHIPRGRMLGGSSSLNVMLHIRGTKYDFDLWEKLGCTGWGFYSVLPYFIKLEDFVDKTRFCSWYHGDDGPVTVSQFAAPDPAIHTISKALESMGVTNVTDLNKPDRKTGYAMSDSTTRNGLRCSTLKAYLIPNSDRPNLFVAKHTRVTRILIEGNKAIGVEFATPTGGRMQVKCTIEVIVSAGVFMSPQLLMLSGIGPKDHLKEMGIDVVADLPVGFNYQDHVAFFGLVLSYHKDKPMKQIIAESQQLRKDTFDLIPKGISTMGLTGLISFVDTTKTNANPDIEIMKIRYSHDTTRHNNTFRKMFGFSDEMATIYDDLNMKSDIVLIIPICNVLVKSGFVTLRSNNPFDPPRIFSKSLSDPKEIETLLRGIEFIVEMCNTKEMADAGYVFEKIVFPGCPHEWGTKEYWKYAIQYVATSIFHSAGTNRMGSVKDIHSVVDPNLKVKGINNLRIIDSSVMPELVSCNINAATMMIGEKGSDIIKKCYGK